jgi:hypothetical protein
MTFRILIASASTIALLATTGAAVAQSARFSDIDRDGDGRLSYEELESRFGAAVAERFLGRNDGEELSRADVSRLQSEDDDDEDDDDDDEDDDDDRGDDDDGRDEDDDDDRDEDDDDDDDDRDDGDDDDDDGDDDDDDDDDD